MKNLFFCISNFIQKHCYIFLGVICLLLAFPISGFGLGNNFTIGLIILAAIPMFSMIIFKSFEKLDEKKIFILFFISGFILRLIYIINTDVTERQHDVEKLMSGIGHSAYIEYIYNNLSIPDFDPRSVIQFYHPPLHHIISALWMRFQGLFGIAYRTAIENVQFLTLFYSSAIVIISAKIFRLFNLKGFVFGIACALVTFNPSLIIMSGSINNDILSIMFIMFTIYNTIIWYKKPNIKNIVFIALSISLGMLSKLSAASVCFSVGVIFIYKFVKSFKIGEVKKYIKQFSIFIAICAPIGLSWSIRNYILFDMPPAYVPSPGLDNPQYIGNIDLIKRFFDFSLYQFKIPYISWSYNSEYLIGHPYFEFNPTIGLLKTASFDEYTVTLDNPVFLLLSKILFLSVILIAALSIICFIRKISSFRKHRIDMMFKFIMIEAAVCIVSYYQFCISYPFTCTMNMRYIVPIIPIFALIISDSLKELKENKNVLSICYKTIVTIVVFTYSTSSFFIMSMGLI